MQISFHIPSACVHRQQFVSFPFSEFTKPCVLILSSAAKISFHFCFFTLFATHSYTILLLLPLFNIFQIICWNPVFDYTTKVLVCMIITDSICSAPINKYRTVSLILLKNGTKKMKLKIVHFARTHNLWQTGERERKRRLREC